MKNTLIFILYLLTSSCANIIAPNGGAKDQKAPEIKYSKLDINTDGNTEIEIVFDERIEINQTSNIFLMPGRIPPKITDITGKKCKLIYQTIADTSQDISLIIDGEIHDVTENNPLKSTYIPIISKSKNNVIFKIHSEFENENKLPVLYYINKISDPGNDKDSSIMQTGLWYQHSNNNIVTPPLSGENIILVALVDHNNNMKPDSGEFYDYVFIHEVTDSIIEITLFPGKDPTLFKTDILYYSQHYGAFTFLIFPPGQQLKLVDNNVFTHESYIQIYPGNICDTLLWFNPDADYPVGYFDLYVNHQWYRDLQATHINNPGIRRPFIIHNPIPDTLNLNKDTLFFSFSNAIQSFDYKKVKLKTSTEVEIKPNIYWLNRNHTVAAFVFDSTISDSGILHITFQDSAIEDVFLQKSNLYKFNVPFRKTKENDNTGALSYTSPLYNSDSIELSITIVCKESIKTYPNYKMYPNSTYNFGNLQPGTYKIIIYKDYNKNGKRDGPWYFSRKSAEPFSSSQEIDIQSGFTVEIQDISWDNFRFR